MKAAESEGIPPDQLRALLADDWRVVGRAKQQPPPGDWTYWVVLGGRGAGKTITGAQWAAKMGREHPGCRIALVAPTFSDVRDTMIEGESGLMTVFKPEEIAVNRSGGSGWNASLGRFTLTNGTRYIGYSAERADRLRGPQHHFAWGDEWSSFKDANRGDSIGTTWSNLKLGVRLGEHPRFVMTSTPKANRLTLDLLDIPEPRLVLTVSSSYENRDNLAESWWQEVVAPYEGTRLGRQEILAEVLRDVEGALWNALMLDDLRSSRAPELARIVVGVDPNASSDEAANNAGVIVAGRDATPDRRGWVLADRTTTRGGPRAWAQASVDAYHDFDADRIVAEANNGGEMVRIMIETVDPNVPVKIVNASRGKRTRAEPVASLYEQGRVWHVGTFPELEVEMTTWTPDAKSPDRMDALVWAMTELLLGGREGGTARVTKPKGQLPIPVRR